MKAALETELKGPSQLRAQLLAELRKAELVSSGRGYSGGYWLAVAPNTVTVADISGIPTGATEARR